MRTIKLCMAGFGNVGRRFARLMEDKREELARKCGVDVQLVGVVTRSKGALVAPEGLGWAHVLEMDDGLGRFDPGDPAFRAWSPARMIEACAAAGTDAFLELTTLSIDDGQPATGYIEHALEHGLHVITANKGPEAWHYDRLAKLAAERGREFLFETIVMDGTPVFNLVRETLHGNVISGMRGILNGTTNFVLAQLEAGVSYEDAIEEAQRMQLAEADPSMDVDGWDGAAKICALANVLMDARLTPRDVVVESISSVTRADIERAKGKGLRIKYVCKAERDEKGKPRLSVRPEMLAVGDALRDVDGTSAALTLYTDLAGEIIIVQTDPGILQTAYGVYSDLLTLIKRTA